MAVGSNSVAARAVTALADETLTLDTVTDEDARLILSTAERTARALCRGTNVQPSDRDDIAAVAAVRTMGEVARAVRDGSPVPDLAYRARLITRQTFADHVAQTTASVQARIVVALDWTGDDGDSRDHLTARVAGPEARFTLTPADAMRLALCWQDETTTRAAYAALRLNPRDRRHWRNGVPSVVPLAVAMGEPHKTREVPASHDEDCPADCATKHTRREVILSRPVRARVTAAVESLSAVRPDAQMALEWDKAAEQIRAASMPRTNRWTDRTRALADQVGARPAEDTRRSQGTRPKPADMIVRAPMIGPLLPGQARPVVVRRVRGDRTTGDPVAMRQAERDAYRLTPAAAVRPTNTRRTKRAGGVGGSTVTVRQGTRPDWSTRTPRG